MSRLAASMSRTSVTPYDYSLAEQIPHPGRQNPSYLEGLRRLPSNQDFNPRWRITIAAWLAAEQWAPLPLRRHWLVLTTASRGADGRRVISLRPYPSRWMT